MIKAKKCSYLLCNDFDILNIGAKDKKIVKCVNVDHIQMNALNNFEFLEIFAQHVRKNVLLSVTFIKNLTQDNK